MKRPATVFFFAFAAVLLCTVVSAAEGPPVSALVGKLRGQDVSFEDWRPILAVGKPAIAELKKLLSDPSDTVRASAAILLYRFGEASALDQLGALLESKDEDARKEAAAALLSFVGSPLDFDAAAPPAPRAEAVARWRAWWKKNRDAAMKAQPLAALYGKILTVDAPASLAAITLSAKHAAKRSMQLNVHRGGEFVCLLQIVMADAKGSVARIVHLSARTPPKPGDLFFWRKR